MLDFLQPNPVPVSSHLAASQSCSSMPVVANPSTFNPSTFEIGHCHSIPASLSSGYIAVDVRVNEPIYIEVRKDLEVAGQHLTRLLRITNPFLEERFNTEKDQLVKSKPFGRQLQCCVLYNQ